MLPNLVGTPRQVVAAESVREKILAPMLSLVSRWDAAGKHPDAAGLLRNLQDDPHDPNAWRLLADLIDESPEKLAEPVPGPHGWNARRPTEYRGLALMIEQTSAGWWLDRREKFWTEIVRELMSS